MNTRLLLPLLLVLTQSAVAAPVTAIMADKAVDIVGFNTHFYYTGTAYDVHYGDIVKPRLLESGVRHIRDGNATNNATYDARLKELAGLGITSLLICDNRYGLAANLTVSRDHIKALNAGAVKVVEMVEGPNERGVDIANGVLRDLTKELWQLMKADPATNALPVAGPSFANTSAEPHQFAATFTTGKAADFMQYGNLHNYPGGQAVEGPGGGGWGITLDQSIAEYRTVCGATAPIVSGETGYHMDLANTGHPGVSELAAAKYFPRMFLTYLRKGFEHLYIYQLINSGENFAVLNDDGSPRRQFTAIKNYITILKDPGPVHTTETLDYSLSGSLTDIHQMLLQKRDKTWYLCVWQGVNSFANKQDVNPPARALTLTVPTSGTIRIYTPLTSDQPQATFTGVTQANLQVPDHVMIVEIRLPGTRALHPVRPSGATLSRGAVLVAARGTQPLGGQLYDVNGARVSRFDGAQRVCILTR